MRNCPHHKTTCFRLRELLATAGRHSGEVSHAQLTLLLKGQVVTVITMIGIVIIFVILMIAIIIIIISSRPSLTLLLPFQAFCH